MIGINIMRLRERNTLLVISVAAIFVLAIVYSVYSATTIDSNISTGAITAASLTSSGVITGTTHIYATSTLQATGVALMYGGLGAGATTSPGATLGVAGAGIFDGVVTASKFISSSVTTSNVFTNATTTSLSVGNVITVLGTATSTYVGGVSAAGLASSVGLRVSAGDTILAGGLNVTGSSILPIASSTSFSIANLLQVNGAGTSTIGALSIGPSLGVLTGRLGVGTTSPYQPFGVTGSIAANSDATTTISAESTGTAGGCIELKSADGKFWARIYAGRGQNATSTTGVSANAVVVIEPGRCQ